MEEHDYPGIRIMMDASLDQMRQSIKIDISTGDIITPGAVEYSYRLMFEDRAISLWTYNLETLLAEKLETVLSRATLNSRMRDFYDIQVLCDEYCHEIDRDMLDAALSATAKKRGSLRLLKDA